MNVGQRMVGWVIERGREKEEKKEKEERRKMGR